MGDGGGSGDGDVWEAALASQLVLVLLLEEVLENDEKEDEVKMVAAAAGNA